MLSSYFSNDLPILQGVACGNLPIVECFFRAELLAFSTCTEYAVKIFFLEFLNIHKRPKP
jgi:hypothetical protein